MDRIKKLEKTILDFLNGYAEKMNTHTDLHHEVLIDPAKKHYQLIRSGWGAIHQLLFDLFSFLKSKTTKIWILKNMTEEFVAKRFTENGISPNEIVLGFQPEHRRPLYGLRRFVTRTASPRSPSARTGSPSYYCLIIL